MEVYFQLIRDAEGVRKACGELAGEKFIGFDTETTELDPYRGDIRLVQLSNGRATQVIDLKPFRENGGLRDNPDLAPLRNLLANPAQIKIAHNAKFDAKWVRQHLGTEIAGVFDTYLASQLATRTAAIRWRMLRNILRGSSLINRSRSAIGARLSFRNRRSNTRRVMRR